MALSKKQRRKLGRYCREIADQLNCRDWTLEVMHDPCDGESLAQIYLTEDRRIAQMSFCDRFASLAPQQQRETVVHELLHCHLNFVGGHVEPLSDLLGDAAFTLWQSVARHRIELATDAIANAVARLLPFPPKL